MNLPMVHSSRSAPITFRSSSWNSAAILQSFTADQSTIPVAELPQIIEILKEDALGEFDASGLWGFL